MLPTATIAAATANAAGSRVTLVAGPSAKPATAADDRELLGRAGTAARDCRGFATTLDLVESRELE